MCWQHSLLLLQDTDAAFAGCCCLERQLQLLVQHASTAYVLSQPPLLPSQRIAPTWPFASKTSSRAALSYAASSSVSAFCLRPLQQQQQQQQHKDWLIEEAAATAAAALSCNSHSAGVHVVQCCRHDR
jgi:hypothetical protein